MPVDLSGMGLHGNYIARLGEKIPISLTDHGRLSEIAVFLSN